MIDSVGTPLLWTGFLAFVLVMLAADLGVFHRRTRCRNAGRQGDAVRGGRAAIVKVT